MEAVCELAVRRYFPPGYDVREVTAFVFELRQAMAGGPTPVDQLMTEAVIRSALGEADVDVSDVARDKRYLIHVWAATLAIARARMDEAAVGFLVTEAENIACGRGWHPPLAG